MKRLLVMPPAYNEQKDIAALFEAWLKEEKNIEALGYKLELVPINDHSTDETLNIIISYEKSRPDVFTDHINHPVNKGLGGGLNSALTYFYKNSSLKDVLCIMDADNTQSPEYIVKMLEKIEDHDVVIASRYCDDSKVKGVPPVRLFLSEGARFYYKLVLGIKGVEDYTCGYRLYSHEIISRLFEKYKDNTIKNSSFACMMELLYKLSSLGASFAEVGFVLRYDKKQGASKIKIIKTILDSLLTALKIRFSA